jgi:NADH-quinone oxidoreductase subunit H
MTHTPLIALITIVVFMAVVMGANAYMILLERKIAAWVQDRVGPNRVGPYGLLQPIADGLKFLLKEEMIPGHVDKFMFLLAPAIALITALLAVAVVPFGPTNMPGQDEYQFVIAPNIDIGILFTFAVTSLAAYAIILGGYASNDKYSFLGALRSSAQLISYEIPLALSIVGVVLLAQSLNLERIVADQVDHGWNVFTQPLAFLLFLIGAFAECNRLPFDLPEAEQELVGGYHTEYSGMKFALFFLAEYTHMITTSLMLSVLFLGGWSFFGVKAASPWAVKLLVVIVKVFFIIVFFMLVRWTIPRFRFDQLMALAWKVMIPLALLNLLCVMVVREFAPKVRWPLLPLSLIILVGAGLVAVKMPRTVRRRVTRAEETEKVLAQ